jgi:hypothetical protein
VQGFVDARFADGSDYLRIIYDHFLPTLSAEQLHALVVAAHKRNRLVVAHEGTQSEGHGRRLRELILESPDQKLWPFVFFGR